MSDVQVWGMGSCSVFWGSHACSLTYDHDGDHQCMDETETEPHSVVGKDGKDASGFQWFLGDDQVVCPCGAELYRYPTDSDDSMAGLGWAIRVAEKHLAEAHGRRAAVKSEESERVA